MKIEFKRPYGSRFFEGTTERGAVFTYSYTKEESLKLHVPSKDEKEVPGAVPPDNEEIKQPTTITLCCNFNLTGEMLDLLEKSKIVFVLGKKYDADEVLSTVMAYPRPGFTYDKLENVITDLCEKFNL